MKLSQAPAPLARAELSTDDLRKLDWLARTVVWLANDAEECKWLSVDALRRDQAFNAQINPWQLLAMEVATCLPLATFFPETEIAAFFGGRPQDHVRYALATLERNAGNDDGVKIWSRKIIAGCRMLIDANMPEPDTKEFGIILSTGRAASAGDTLHLQDRWQAALQAERAHGLSPTFGPAVTGAPETRQDNAPVPFLNAPVIAQWPGLGDWLTEHGVTSAVLLAERPLFKKLYISAKTIDKWSFGQAPLHVATTVEAALSRLTGLPQPPNRVRRFVGEHRPDAPIL